MSPHLAKILEDWPVMKFIIHAPAYMASAAAGVAALEWVRGGFKKTDLIGIVRDGNAFSIRKNKSSITVWYFGRAEPNGGMAPE